MLASRWVCIYHRRLRPINQWSINQQLHHIPFLSSIQKFFFSLIPSSRTGFLLSFFIMEPSKLKTEVTASDFAHESHALDSKIRLANILELATQALTALALLAGVSILGLSADALKTYNETHVPPEYLLPLWPDELDLRGNVSLVACSAIVVAVSLIALATSKVSLVRCPIISLSVNM